MKIWSFLRLSWLPVKGATTVGTLWAFAIFGCASKPVVVPPPLPLSTPYTDPASMQIAWIYTDSQVASIRGAYEIALDYPASTEVYQIASYPVEWQRVNPKQSQRTAKLSPQTVTGNRSTTTPAPQIATTKKKRSAAIKPSAKSSSKSIAKNSQYQESTIFYGLLSFSGANCSVNETVLESVLDSLLAAVEDKPDVVIRLLGHASGEDYQGSLDAATDYLSRVREHILKRAPSATLELFNIGNSMPLTLSNGTKVQDCVEVMALKQTNI